MPSTATTPWSAAAAARCPETMKGVSPGGFARPRSAILSWGFGLFLCLPVLAACFNCAPDQETTAAAGLVGIPLPDFASMEPGVREQFESGQARLDAALARARAEPGELSRLLGRQGQLYLAYSFELAAAACFRNAEHLAPGDFRWSYYLGNLLSRGGKWEESRDHYERVLQLNPEYLPAAVALADLYLEANLPGEAGKVLDEVGEKEASHAAVLVRRGRLASFRNDHERAVQYLEAALELDPGATVVFYPLGLAYRALGEVEKARFFMERRGPRQVALEDPLMEVIDGLAAGSRSLQARGNEAYRQGRLEEALEAYQKAVEADPDNGEFRVNLAAVLSRMDDPDGAAGHLRQALRTRPPGRPGPFQPGGGAGAAGLRPGKLSVTTARPSPSGPTTRTLTSIWPTPCCGCAASRPPRRTSAASWSSSRARPRPWWGRRWP